ncbi:hypothetical protein TIFTF001_051219 [Ficus carica]|uniref:Uncharacterized protein n=1 Tax=Ficus carica TaxID=3494 RepID=A0AA88CLQ9_FICCA|nr:hypothetical protein TIFTF001_051219 [Ficus carica]
MFLALPARYFYAIPLAEQLRSKIIIIRKTTTTRMSKTRFSSRRDPKPEPESSNGVSAPELRASSRNKRLKQTPLPDNKLSVVPDIEEFADKKASGSASSS